VVSELYGDFLMTWVYLAVSERFPAQRYIGHTTALDRRIDEHDAGLCHATKPYPPWHVVVAIAFIDHRRAIEFEGYLKSGSGRAFANRHLW
jgi:putative endonuclease